MKKVLLGGLFLSLFAISCSKDGDDGEEPVTAVYLNSKAGSTWNYETTDNATPGTPETYTLTSTNRDSTVNGKSYHVYTNSSSGASEYNNKTGNDYYRFQALPADLGGQNVEELYLKSGSAVNASWTQSFNIPAGIITFMLTNTNKIVEKNISRTVNGTLYNNVTHVKTDVAISGLPPGTVTITSDIHQYYAPNYGMIEANIKFTVDFMGSQQVTDVSTKLKSATLL